MSFTYNNLPGVQVVTVDGGMAAVNTPRTQSVLVFGTSGIGPAASPYQVVDTAVAAKVFDLDGTLIRTMSEVSTYCDNVFLYRIGTTPGTFLVGKQIAGSDTLGTSNAVTAAASVGGVITYTVSPGPPSADLVVGGKIQVTGFTNLAFNSGSTQTTGAYYNIDTIDANPTGGYHVTVNVLGVADATETHAAVLRLSTPVVNMVGYTVSLGQVDATANTRYKIWYSAGVLYIWLDGNLIYANDTGNSTVVNTGDSQVTGTTSGGLPVGTSGATLANAITIAAATALSGTSTNPTPVYVAPVTGIGMTGRQTYIAQQVAMDLMQGFPVDMVVVPNAYFDQPNIAYYVSSDATTASNNPATNADALAWLKTVANSDGTKTFQWSNESVDSTGTAATPVTYTDAATRIAANFHEVNFGYQLARFCAAQSEAPQATNAGCVGFIGVQGPSNLSNFSLPAVRSWIGFLPSYDSVSGNPSVPGSGVLGIPYLVGTTSAKLHAATSDHANGFRLPGLFSTASKEYDGGAEIDANGSKVDIGAYLAVQGDWALLSNGFGQYVGNIAGVVAGLCSSLDQKNAITNKPIAGVQQLYRASLSQLDSLTFADVNVLRFKGPGRLPTCLHDKTAATAASDYIFVLRQRIKFLVVQALLQQADPFIGNGSNDGLQMVALKTALDAQCLNLQKRGYLSNYNFTITSTAAQQKIGQASINVSFVPANELVQLRATVGINLAG